MDKQEAFESLESIRTILERSTTFAHIAPISLFLGGVVAITASMLGHTLDWQPAATPGPFLILWGLVFTISLGAGLSLSAKRARRLGERFWSRKLEFVIAGFLPVLIAAALLTTVLVEIGYTELAPGIWMVLYGVGILAVGVVLDWEFRAAAWAFLLAGSMTLFLLRDVPYFALAATFGALHIALGAFRLYRESWNSCHDRQQPMRSFRI